MKTSSTLFPVFILTFCRLVINLSRRFPYPFLSPISRELNVEVGAIQNVLAVQAGIGVTSPLFGPLSERFGRKRVMIGSLILMMSVSVLGALFTQFWIFALIMIIDGVGKMIFDPSMQAYIGDHVPYFRRAQAIGIVELSWAGSLIIAAPMAGFLLDSSGLRTVFVAIAVALLLAIITITLLLPEEKPREKREVAVLNPFYAWGVLRRSPTALAALSFSVLIAASNELFFINYGLWMELSFDLVLTALGIVTWVVAAAEILGEFIVIGVADRIGKRGMTLIGIMTAGFAYLILPSLSFSLPVTLIGLFVMFVGVESAIVASIPMFTEILPDSRSVMMSGNVAAHSLGRMSGAWMGGLLYGLTQNFQLISIIAMIGALTGAFIFWRFLREQN